VTTLRIAAAVAAAIIAACIILGLTRIDKVMVGQWKVVVVDEHDQPVQGIRVSESCSDYDFDWHGGLDVQTDAHGVVVFPPLRMRASLLYWWVGPVVTKLKYGVHAGSGRSTLVSVTDIKAENDRNSFSCSNGDCERRTRASVIRIKMRSVELLPPLRRK
jgi:hypothetical protein